MNHRMFTTNEELEALGQAMDFVRRKALSLREAALWLNTRTGKKMSHEGLRKIIKNDDAINTPPLGD